MREFDPSSDTRIAATYSEDDLSGKAACKKALQEELWLEVRPEVPVIAMVGRLNSQKGLDLVDYVIADIMREDVQLVCLGMGESRYVNLFSWAEQNYPGRVAAQFVMDNNLAHRVYAGADLFLMPSAFEPCGLSQLIALRYGTVPVVRETGGLRDTVLSFNEYTGEGNGFSFFNYNAHDMLHVLQRALKYYHGDKETWAMLQRRGMETDYSWLNSSRKYLELYQKLLPMLLGAPPRAVKPAPAPAVEAKPAPAPAGDAKPAAAVQADPKPEAPKRKAPAAKAAKAEEPKGKEAAEPAKKPAAKKPKAAPMAEAAAESPKPEAAAKKPRKPKT